MRLKTLLLFLILCFIPVYATEIAIEEKAQRAACTWRPNFKNGMDELTQLKEYLTLKPPYDKEHLTYINNFAFTGGGWGINHTRIANPDERGVFYEAFAKLMLAVFRSATLWAPLENNEEIASFLASKRLIGNQFTLINNAQNLALLKHQINCNMICLFLAFRILKQKTYDLKALENPIKQLLAKHIKRYTEVLPLINAAFKYYSRNSLLFNHLEKVHSALSSPNIVNNKEENKVTLTQQGKEKLQQMYTKIYIDSHFEKETKEKIKEESQHFLNDKEFNANFDKFAEYFYPYPLSFNNKNSYLMPTQGWKIHISARLDSRFKIVRAIWPVLIAENITFKIMDLKKVQSDLAQRGKFITIYPNNDEDAKKIAELLDPILKRECKPQDFIPIAYDRPLGNSGGLFTRYGELRGGNGFLKVVDKEGKPRLTDGEEYTEDVRIGTYKPDWVDWDPFEGTQWTP